MFLGEFRHSMDAKGRVVLPSKFRDELEEGCVVTKGQERCLFVFTKERWEREVERVMGLPRTDRRARNFSRAFFSGATDQVPDRQGRIAVPTGLRDYAGIRKDVTVLGVADRIEIWSTDLWERVRPEADDYYAEIEETLSEDGI